VERTRRCAGLALAYVELLSCLPDVGVRVGNTFGRWRSRHTARSGSPYGVAVVQRVRHPAANVGHALGCSSGPGDLHRLHDVAALRVSGAVLLVFVLLTITFILLAIERAAAHQCDPLGGYIASRPRSRRGTRRLRMSSTAPSEDGRAGLPAQQVGKGRSTHRGCRGAPPRHPSFVLTTSEVIADGD